ncbi:hypothetical protein [Streptomyces fuscigenes]|uniref:hypothetical protein n=1 Tax=Streptomyces fuscigenes TaxID=1528880 RepID=UPI001F34267A|nr:hypothetical protein [Streptomyces fuscigenes]MCF3963832.1 hypothetical protein [Streptomyces fuscigenes]
MEAVLLIVLLLFVAAVLVGGYVTVKAVGAAKRGVDRTISQARRSVEDTTLRAKSFGQPGLPGELAQLRLRLRTSMRATQDVLHAAAPADESLAESVRLFERLSAHGQELESRLKQAERDPDRAGVGARLPELRERTEQVTRAADSLRWAIGDRVRRSSEDDLSALSTDIVMESEALRHWAPVEEPGDQYGQGPGAPHGRDAHGPDAYGPEAYSPEAGAQGPQALDPADGRRLDGVHSWQRNPWRKSAPPKTSN